MHYISRGVQARPKVILAGSDYFPTEHAFTTSAISRLSCFLNNNCCSNHHTRCGSIIIMGGSLALTIIAVSRRDTRYRPPLLQRIIILPVSTAVSSNQWYFYHRSLVYFNLPGRVEATRSLRSPYRRQGFRGRRKRSSFFCPVTKLKRRLRPDLMSNVQKSPNKRVISKPHRTNVLLHVV